MQKKIIALAIAAAMTAPAAAMAEVKVYGQANMAYEVVDTGNTTTGVGTAADSRNKVSSNTSRLGFKGSEDIGSGLTAVWQMEAQVKLDSASTTKIFDRNTFMGVAGGFGTVVLGQHDTPYKMATRGMDVFADTIADNRSIMGGGHDARLTDVLAYLTPNFGGFTAAVAMVGGTDNTFGGAATTEISATSLFAKFAMDKWSVVLGNQNVTGTDSVVAANKFDMTATKVGGSFSMDMFSVNAAYEMLSSKTGAAGTKTEQNNLYVSGTVNVSDAGKVKLAYTMAGESKTGGTTVAGSGSSQVAVGYDHAMTKSTTLFALYTMTGNDSAATYGFTSGGSTGDTTLAGPPVTSGINAGSDPTALAVGIRHSF